LGKSATEIPLPELFDRFTKFKAKQKGLTQSSITTRYLPVRKVLEKILDVPANEIGKREAEKFADFCAKTIEPATAKARISLMVSCFDWAKGKYHVAEENPFADLSDRFHPCQSKQSEPHPFTAEEVRAILSGFRSSQYYAHYTDFVSFLFGTGCRFGEAVGLRWEHIAPDFSTVHICQSITRGVVGATKTKRSRKFNLSSSIATMLERRKEDLQPQPSDLVFSTPTGLSINDRNFRRRAWTQVLKAAGVEYRKPYTTRSTALNHALVNGAHYINVAKAAGHSPQVLHDKYVNAIDKRSVFVDFE
jgi:integrase